jgi:hypothetical protein
MPPEPDELTEVLKRLARVPDRARRFTRNATWAWRHLRLRPELLRSLTDRGLPHRSTEDGHRYDEHDLLNCAMEVGHGIMARSARRYWPLALRRAARGIRSSYELQFQLRCPEPGHDGPCAYRVALPGGAILVHSVAAGGPAGTIATVEVAPLIDWPELPSTAHEAIAEVRDLEFVILSEHIRFDLDFNRDSGLVDCVGGSRLLVEAAQRHGLSARNGIGYILAPPFAVEHFWTELLVDGAWVPIDPILVRRMVAWGVLDATAWPDHRSVGPLVVQVNTGALGVRHNGTRIPATLPVRLLHDPA